MGKKWIRIAGLGLVLALAGAACAGTEQTQTGQGGQGASPSVTQTQTDGSDTGAADLRATLTSALQEHEYLAGIAVYSAVNTGLDSKTTKGAMAALDENTEALAAAIGSVYGADAEKAFLPLWRKHIEFFVSYTVGGVTNDEQMQAKAKKDLDGYRSDFGAFLASANPNLTKEAVADALVPHVESTFDAIDAVVAKKRNQFSKLREGAQKMPAIAEVLAGAIVKQFPEKF